MKILLTGSSGFIGCNLKMKLLAEGYEIFEVNRENGFDLSNRNWTKSIPNKSFDYVIHLAQSNQYRDFPKGAVDMVQINIEATSELLEWSRNNGIECFFYASTGNVYEQKPSPLTENDRTLPNSFYGTTKLCAENLIIQYQRYFNTKIMRLFGVYGPGQKTNRLIPFVIKNCIQKKKFDCSHGLQSRDFIYIDDLTNAIKIILSTNKKIDGKIFNIGFGRSIKLKNVINSLTKKLGGGLPLFGKLKMRKDETLNSFPKIDLIKSLGWSPKVNFEKGLNKTIFYYKTKYKTLL